MALIELASLIIRCEVGVGILGEKFLCIGGSSGSKQIMVMAMVRRDVT